MFHPSFSDFRAPLVEISKQPRKLHQFFHVCLRPGATEQVEDKMESWRVNSPSSGSLVFLQSPRATRRGLICRGLFVPCLLPSSCSIHLWNLNASTKTATGIDSWGPCLVFSYGPMMFLNDRFLRGETQTRDREKMVMEYDFVGFRGFVLLIRL